MLLMYGSQAASILYYEVLDLPLPELEKLKIVKVAPMSARHSKNILVTSRVDVKIISLFSGSNGWKSSPAQLSSLVCQVQ